MKIWKNLVHEDKQVVQGENQYSGIHTTSTSTMTTKRTGEALSISNI